MRSDPAQRPSRAVPRRVRRLAVLWAFAFALLKPAVSFASAPFCDPSGMSMVAPVPALPNATGELAAPAPCDDGSHESLATSRTRHDAPRLDRVVDPPERVIVPVFGLPARESVQLPAPDALVAPALPGDTKPVYRPPRV